MESIYNVLVSIIETIANLGAGAASMGVAYEPEVPQDLL